MVVPFSSVSYLQLLQSFPLQLLMQCMSGALGQEGVEVQAHRLSQVLVRVHRLMVAVRPRLQAVLDMAACHPQAIQALQEKRRDPQTRSSIHEAELVRTF